MPELPIHFLTIVLNGEPFIRYHIGALSLLPFPWHWHVVEGVAALRHDTAWSLSQGGSIPPECHDRGLSTDGTSAYLDELQRLFPDRVHIYRKPRGLFWDGKREMVNAPLPQIREQCLLWQLDADELWTPAQIITMRECFLAYPERTAAQFWCWYFVGEHLVVSSRYGFSQQSWREWHRVWRFWPGMVWLSHEPPQLTAPRHGGAAHPFTHEEMAAAGLIFQHYALVTAEQLHFKESYYGYRHALSQWQRLQSQTVFPQYLGDYLAWVEDDTMVEPIASLGITPIAQRSGDGTWHFRTHVPLSAYPEAAIPQAPRVLIDGLCFADPTFGRWAKRLELFLRAWAEHPLGCHILVLSRQQTAPRIPGIRLYSYVPYDPAVSAIASHELQNLCTTQHIDVFLTTGQAVPITTPSICLVPNPETFSQEETQLAILHASHYWIDSPELGRALQDAFPHITEQDISHVIDANQGAAVLSDLVPHLHLPEPIWPELRTVQAQLQERIYRAHQMNASLWEELRRMEQSWGWRVRSLVVYGRRLLGVVPADEPRVSPTARPERQWQQLNQRIAWIKTSKFWRLSQQLSQQWHRWFVSRLGTRNADRR